MSRNPYLLEIVWPNGKRQGLSFPNTRKRQIAADAAREQGATVKLHDQLQLGEERQA